MFDSRDYKATCENLNESEETALFAVREAFNGKFLANNKFYYAYA